MSCLENYLSRTHRYHLDCLSPPLTEVPEGDWYCVECLPVVLAQYFASAMSDSEYEFNSGSPEVTDIHSGFGGSSSSEDDSDSDSSWKWTLQTGRHTRRLLVSETSSDSEREAEETDDSSYVVQPRRRSMQTGRHLMSESSSEEENVHRKAGRDEEDDESEGADSQMEAIHFIVAKRTRPVGVRLSSGEDDGEALITERWREKRNVQPFLDLDSYNSTSETTQGSASEAKWETMSYSASKDNVVKSNLLDSSDNINRSQRRRGGAPRRLEYDSEEEVDGMRGAMIRRNDTAGRSIPTLGKAETEKTNGHRSEESRQADSVVVVSDSDGDRLSICSGYFSPRDSSDWTSLKPSEAASTSVLSESECPPSKEHQNPVSPEDGKERVGNGGTHSQARPVTWTILPGSSALEKKQLRTSRKRKRSRKGKGKRKSAAGNLRKAVGVGGKRRRKKRKKKNSAYVPSNSLVVPVNSRRRTRASTASARARTVATHSPHTRLIRAAVYEAHRHPDLEQGLHSAQAIMRSQYLRQKRESLLNSPFRSGISSKLTSATPSTSTSKLTTPHSGYTSPGKMAPVSKLELSTPSLSSSVKRTNDRMKGRSILSGFSCGREEGTSNALTSQQGPRREDKAW